MTVVDTHAHADAYFLEPIEVLQFQMERNGVDKAVLVQFGGQTDNTYLLDCVRQSCGRFSPVVVITHHVNGGIVDGDAPATLARLVKDGAEGVRLHVADRSSGPDPLTIWRTAQDLGISVSCRGESELFASQEFERLVKELPALNIVIEHYANVRHDSQPEVNFPRVLDLAKYTNVYMKIGGLGEICRRPYPFPQPFPYNPVPPYLEMVLEAFSPRRVMWGSDHPPVGHREGYRNCLGYLRQYLSSRTTEDDREWIFGKTALAVFQFGGRESAVQQK